MVAEIGQQLNRGDKEWVRVNIEWMLNEHKYNNLVPTENWMRKYGLKMEYVQVFLDGKLDWADPQSRLHSYHKVSLARQLWHCLVAAFCGAM